MPLTTLRPRSTVLAVAAPVVVTAALIVATGGAAFAAAGSASAQPARASATPTAARVTLPTGDTVVVGGTATRPQLGVSSPSHRGYSSWRRDGDLYLVPRAAVPYLDRTVDSHLFDVTALAADTARQIPVAVTFTNAGSRSHQRRPHRGHRPPPP